MTAGGQPPQLLTPCLMSAVPPRQLALATCAVQVAFFLLGLCYGCMTFKIAAQIHLEAYYAMPKGHCKQLVMWMALVRGLAASQPRPGCRNEGLEFCVIYWDLA